MIVDSEVIYSELYSELYYIFVYVIINLSLIGTVSS